MKSQKQSNKAPRPFKMKNSERGWSGGRQHKASLPPAKPLLAMAKKNTASPPSEGVK